MMSNAYLIFILRYDRHVADVRAAVVALVDSRDGLVGGPLVNEEVRIIDDVK